MGARDAGQPGSAHEGRIPSRNVVDPLLSVLVVSIWQRAADDGSFPARGRSLMPKCPPTVIGIPGRWPNRSDIVTSIASRSDGYLFAGMVMMKLGTKDGFTLEIYEHDPNLKNAF